MAIDKSNGQVDRRLRRIADFVAPFRVEPGSKVSLAKEADFVLATARITDLRDHFKKHTQDHHSRPGPLTMAGRPRLQITKKCKMIRKGLAGKFCYRRVQVAGDERYTDEPDKNEWSHPVEALEYALQGEGEGLVVKQVRNLGTDYSDWSVPVNA